ncbi:MAG: hypothetical protein KDE56_22505 [Anaerolineales bacterium]|nr:hypothetical protein [Anaerolineales bacterium]
MKKQNRHHLLSTSWLLALLAFAMLLPQAAQGAPSDTPERQIEAAWERAQASNAYQYRSQLEQTVYPLPKIANAGRQPHQQFIGMEGEVNLAQKSLNLTLWQDASFDPNRAVAIRVENGVSYARTGQNEWREVDNLTDLLAPGGDPMGFLGSIKNVSLGEARELNLAGKTVWATQYVFELDGPAFAEQMKQQLEQQLAQQGKLPPGLELASSDAYKTMAGGGELWLDGDGLPLRMAIEADFPQQGEQERITAVITNDYFNYDKTQLGLATTPFVEAPRIWLQTRMPGVKTAVSFTLLTLLALTLAYFFYATWRTKALQRVLAALVIVPMIVSPLLRGHVVAVFAAEQKAKQVTWQQQKAEADSQAAARDAEKTTDWRPNEAAAGQLREKVAETAVLTTNQTPFAPVAAADSDGDGLSDTDEVGT